jgi:small subunit ribosomal protein S16
MLSIRLTRTGKTHSPQYRIVVQEKRSKLNGKAIANLGHYHPAHTDKLLVINKEETEKWLAKGAQPSATVTNLLVKEGILDQGMKIHHFFTPKATEEPAPDTAVLEEPVTEDPIIKEPVKEEVVEEVVEEVKEPVKEEVTEEA